MLDIRYLIKRLGRRLAAFFMAFYGNARLSEGLLYRVFEGVFESEGNIKI